MPYRRSRPLQRWLGDRRANIAVLEAAHATMGDVTGPGRPLEVGRPLGHAYVLRLVAEFQGFVRDMHDLAADRVVQLSQPDIRFVALLGEAITGSRAIDKGNAGIANVDDDFRRFGLTGLKGKLAARSAHWSGTPRSRGDQAYYQDLIELRNALAQGNERRLSVLRARNVLDTVSWARARLPGLNRTAGALDHVVWDHLLRTFGQEPW